LTSTWGFIDWSGGGSSDYVSQSQKYVVKVTKEMAGRTEFDLRVKFFVKFCLLIYCIYTISGGVAL